MQRANHDTSSCRLRPFASSLQVIAIPSLGQTLETETLHFHFVEYPLATTRTRTVWLGNKWTAKLLFPCKVTLAGPRFLTSTYHGLPSKLMWGGC